MIALTIVEDLGVIAEGLLALSVVAGVFWAGWRGIKVIVVHRQNGEDE